MQKQHVQDTMEMIGNTYDSKLVREIIISGIMECVYIPFYDTNDLDDLLHLTCQEKSWDYETAIAVYSDPDLGTTASGQTYGSCLIVPHTTFPEFVGIIQKTIKMKAFL
jgi:hypothetical protein